MRTRLTISLRVVLAAVLLGGCATSLPPADAQARLAQSLKAHRAAAIGVAAIRQGRIAWSVVAGEAAPGKPADAQTMFNVASLAKPVTAELAVRLVSAGRMSLDEPMSSHWVDPDVASDPRHRKLTPRHALSHQTGFANWRGDSKDGRLAFSSDPGSGFTYSGEGYEYLRHFMEQKTGQPFESLASQYVFGPLGMTGVTFSDRSRLRARFATPMNNDGAFRSLDLQPEGKPNAADNLFVTVEDYARLLIGVAQGRGISRALAAERMTTQVEMPAPAACKSAGTAGCPDRSDFGLGWVLYRFGAQTIVSNSGKDWGEFALVYFDAATGDGMVYLVNGGNGVPVVMDAMELFDPDSPVLTFGRAQMKP